MNHRLFSILTLTAAPLAGAEPPAQQLTITVATPKVAIAPQNPGRQFLPLPALEFQFLLEPRCEAGWAPLSMTLSIADSRIVLNAESLDEHGFLAASLAVPAAQLAPVPVSGFCEQSAAEDNVEQPAAVNEELRFPAALSAHGALICSNAGTEQISYTSRPLPLTFYCTAEPATVSE
ncbi:MAG: hypothetical protein WBM54_05825 [Woeseia sp.]